MMNEILVLSFLLLCNTVPSLTLQKKHEEMKEEMELADCKSCGLSFTRPSKLPVIIDGTNVASETKYPWMVSLVRRDCDEPFCGGAILNQNFILTAAHCLCRYINESSCRNNNGSCEPTDKIFVKFFTPDWYPGVKPRIQVDKIMVQLEFFNHEIYYDIALVKLTRPFKCNTLANPICLPPPNVSLRPGQVLRFAGYGKSRASAVRASNVLLDGLVMAINETRCLQMGFEQKEMNQLYCMRGFSGHAVCYGDSGSSMFGRLKKEGEFVAIGVASFTASETCDPRSIMVFSSVAHHLDWIKHQMSIHS